MLTLSAGFARCMLNMRFKQLDYSRHHDKRDLTVDNVHAKFSRVKGVRVLAGFPKTIQPYSKPSEDFRGHSEKFRRCSKHFRFPVSGCILPNKTLPRVLFPSKSATSVKVPSFTRTFLFALLQVYKFVSLAVMAVVAQSFWLDVRDWSAGVR